MLNLVNVGGRWRQDAVLSAATGRDRPRWMAIHPKMTTRQFFRVNFVLAIVPSSLFGISRSSLLVHRDAKAWGWCAGGGEGPDDRLAANARKGPVADAAQQGSILAN